MVEETDSPSNEESGTSPKPVPPGRTRELLEQAISRGDTFTDAASTASRMAELAKAHDHKFSALTASIPADYEALLQEQEAKWARVQESIATMPIPPNYQAETARLTGELIEQHRGHLEVLGSMAESLKSVAKAGGEEGRRSRRAIVLLALTLAVAVATLIATLMG